MTAESLKQSLDDLVALLVALDRIVPDRVGEELLAALDTVRESPILVELLLAALNLSKVAEAKGVRR